MSAGDPIEIEDQEVVKVMTAVKQRSIVVCKNGVINPVHFVSIVPAEDPYKGSNIPIEERTPQRPITDRFSILRTTQDIAQRIGL